MLAQCSKPTLHQWYSSDLDFRRSAIDWHQRSIPIEEIELHRPQPLQRIAAIAVEHDLATTTRSLSPGRSQHFARAYGNRKIRALDEDKLLVSVLSILASAQGIKIDRSQEYLNALPYTESEFLVAPNHHDFVDRLTQPSWSVVYSLVAISLGTYPNNRHLHQSPRHD